MNLTMLFQTAYTVCFILSGVLFAAAVFVFFRYNIPGVIESLSGIRMPGKRAGAARKGRGTAPPAGRGRKTRKTEQVFSTATLTESSFAPEPDKRAGNTVWMDTRGTSCLDGADADMDEQTGELEGTVGTLNGAGLIDGAEAAARARAAIRFVPERKTVIVHSGERI